MKIHFRCDPALEDVLPRPIAAAHGLPDWLRDMSPKALSDLHGREIRTVKQCPPFVDAMRYGFLILLPCDIDVDRGVFHWDWKIAPPSVEGHPRAPLSFHVPEQTAGTPFSDGATAALKFNSFWTIELEPGWSLYASHPPRWLPVSWQIQAFTASATARRAMGHEARRSFKLSKLKNN